MVAYHVPATENPPVKTISVEWKSIGEGHFVPESARLSKRSVAYFADKPFHLKEETTLEVHWFFFNKELDPGLFDEKPLQDSKKLDELLNTDVFEGNESRRAGDK